MVPRIFKRQNDGGAGTENLQEQENRKATAYRTTAAHVLIQNLKEEGSIK